MHARRKTSCTSHAPRRHTCHSFRSILCASLARRAQRHLAGRAFFYSGRAPPVRVTGWNINLATVTKLLGSKTRTSKTILNLDLPFQASARRSFNLDKASLGRTVLFRLHDASTNAGPELRAKGSSRIQFEKLRMKPVRPFGHKIPH
jgi:hypothetical protein